MPSAEPCRVLIVDDDADLRRLLTCVLEEDGRFTVVGTADSAGSAMTAVEAHTPDLLILDHGLPDALGAHSVHGLKSMAEDMLVVIFSGLAVGEDADQLEVDSWIDKSDVWVLPDLLVSVLAKDQVLKSA